jgi:hypothetical protein
MLSVHMLPNASQKRVIRLRHEDRVRDVVLYMHEKIIHEFVDPIEFGVPPEWANVDDVELRGMIRALRWVLDDSDEDLL